MEHTSEQEHESNFVKVFIAVLVALTLFTLFCIFIARALAPVSTAADDSILRNAMLARIAPVGSVNTSADQIDSQPAASSESAGPETAEQLVTRACAACHLSGAAGAPKLDDDAEWAKRREAGLDALVASVVNGKGAMPARAGSDLTDEQLVLAVQQLAGFPVDEAAGSESDESSAAADDTATATTEVAAVTSAAGVEISAKAKSVAESLCIGCHLAGVAGAPKIGDKEDWGKRAERGMDEMVKTVVTGKGAMPARGGSDLTDEEIAGAIQYLMDK